MALYVTDGACKLYKTYVLPPEKSPVKWGAGWAVGPNRTATRMYAESTETRQAA